MKMFCGGLERKELCELKMMEYAGEKPHVPDSYYKPRLYMKLLKLYVVIWDDRHTDTTVYPFADADHAITEAKRIAKEYCKNKEDYRERDYGKNDEFLFYAGYSSKGDHVRVETVEVNQEI